MSLFDLETCFFFNKFEWHFIIFLSVLENITTFQLRFKDNRFFSLLLIFWLKVCYCYLNEKGLKLLNLKLKNERKILKEHITMLLNS